MPLSVEAWELSLELAQVLGQVRVCGDSWFFPSESDREEDEHRIDRLAGGYYCTCQGFLRWKHCKHVDRRRAMEENTTALVERTTTDLTRHDPRTLSVRLADMVENRSLTQRFFKEVMQEGIDYGVIPGTEKPTLFKAGAESLLELYGYAPTIKDVQETVDYQSGFLRNVVTIALIQRSTGDVVAEGIGECNTREARYFYRWVPEWQLPPMSAEEKKLLKWQERSGKRGKFKVYRLENDDVFTLWNTVKKMAKKRALVDATLSATRSSGIFNQSQAALEDWIEAEYEDVTDRERPVGVDADGVIHGEAQASQSAPPAASPDASPPADETPQPPAAWREMCAHYGLTWPELVEFSNARFGSDPLGRFAKELAKALEERGG